MGGSEPLAPGPPSRWPDRRSTSRVRSLRRGADNSSGADGHLRTAPTGPREVPVEEIEKSAASVEEAIEAALEELGLSEQEAMIEIVQEPRQGFLGLSAHPAVVRVRRASSIPPADDDLEPEDVEEQAELAVEF